MLKTITTSQIIVNEKKQDLSISIDKNLRFVIAIS